jgi:hypothetical protein
MAVLTDAQKQQIAAKYYQIFQQYQQNNDPAAYLQAKTAFEQSLGDDEKTYYESIVSFQGQEDTDKYWKRIEKLAGGGGAGQLTTGPDGKPATLGGQVTQQMSDFLNYLNQPVDLNSPFARQVLMSAQRGSQQGSYNRGLGTEGFANTQAQQAYMGAALGLEQQRQANLLQALGLGSGRDIGLQNVDLSRQAQAEQRYQFDVGQAYKQYQQDQQNQMAGMGLVGGVGGAVVGGLTGGPAGIMPGAQLGSRALAGLGGLTYPTFSAPQRF